MAKIFAKLIPYTEYKIILNNVYVDRTSKFSFCKSFTVMLEAETGHQIKSKLLNFVNVGVAVYFWFIKNDNYSNKTH